MNWPQHNSHICCGTGNLHTQAHTLNIPTGTHLPTDLSGTVNLTALGEVYSHPPKAVSFCRKDCFLWFSLILHIYAEKKNPYRGYSFKFTKVCVTFRSNAWFSTGWFTYLLRYVKPYRLPPVVLNMQIIFKELQHLFSRGCISASFSTTWNPPFGIYQLSDPVLQ